MTERSIKRPLLHLLNALQQLRHPVFDITGNVHEDDELERAVAAALGPYLGKSLATVEFGELIKKACEHANQFVSVAASDPWWITVADILLNQIEVRRLRAGA